MQTWGPMERLERVMVICRIGFMLIGGVILGASTATLVDAQNRAVYVTEGDIMAEKVTGHDVRIKIGEDNVKELQAEMRDMASQVNTIRGMGMGFGFIMSMLQVVQFMTDRRLKLAKESGGIA